MHTVSIRAGNTSNSPKMRELKPVSVQPSELVKQDKGPCDYQHTQEVCICNTKRNQRDNIQNIVLVEIGIKIGTHKKVNVEENNVYGIMQRNDLDEQGEIVS